MAHGNSKMKRILFYGSIEGKANEKVRQFLQIFIPRLLSSNYQIVTREGTNCPDKYPLLWLDNLVLDIACEHRDKNSGSTGSNVGRFLQGL